MGMVVRTNTMALNAYRQLGMNNSAVSKSLEKLSSGFKINRAGDDAAGLAISEKMKAQIKGLETASSNAQDGISLIQTAEGNLNEVHSMLNRMVELATKSANGTYQNEVDREAIQAEVDSLLEEIDRISQSANFNGIKLLNGELGKSVLTSRFAEIEQGTVSSVSGIELKQGTNGAGAKGTFEIDLAGKMFGTGDTLKVDMVDATGAATDITLSYGASVASDINGYTVEDQAASIAKKLSNTASFSTQFDITSNGSKVIITAKEEGIQQPKITGITATNVDAALGAFTAATTGQSAAAGPTNAGWDSILGSGTNGGATGWNAQVGDILEFNFKDSAGNVMTAKVEFDATLAGMSVEDATAEIVTRLNKTSFVDNGATVADESALKVGDLFTVEANKGAATDANGSIKVSGGTGAAAGMVVDKLVIRMADGNERATITGSTGTAATATQAVYEVAGGGTNFSVGDDFTIKGTLSDGRDFEITLTAGIKDDGNTFALGTDYKSTMSSIAKALTDADSTAKITVRDGKNTTEYNANEVFAAAADITKEFTFVVDNSGKVTMTNQHKGVEAKGVAGKVTSVTVTPNSEGDASLTIKSGVNPGEAVSTITFDKDKIDYGAAVKIGDKVFELVADSRDVTSRNNIAVEVKDLKNASSAQIAKAFMEAAAKQDEFVARTDISDPNGNILDAKVTEAQDKGVKYSVSISGGELSIATLEKGSTVAAPTLDTVYGDKVEYITAKFDPAKLKYGDSFNFNDNTYEFVAKAEDAKEGHIGIVVPDIAKATAKTLGDAFADVSKNGVVSVAEDGTVTLKANVDPNGVKGKLSLTFDGKGLTLQIGDTSDSFNRVSVFVENMSSKGLGVDGLNVLDQDAAGDAINVIRDAINKVSTARANMGALQNRLEYTINNLDVAAENMSAANSRIRDTDMAKEMMNYTKMNVLVQSAQAMLAQANQQPQSVLQLLQ